MQYPRSSAPDAAAGADVDVVNAFGGAHFGAADVVFEKTIAAVDDGIAFFHAGEQSLNRFFSGVAGRNHDPGGAGRRSVL